MTDTEREMGRRFPGVAFPDTGTARIPAGMLVEIVDWLKSRREFSLLTNLTAVDYKSHFRLVYHLVRPTDAFLYTLELEAKAGETVPSLTAVWRSALWQEREVYDLLGIVFNGHPDLRRILLDDDFVGHPLRKDYAVRKSDGV